MIEPDPDPGPAPLTDAERRERLARLRRLVEWLDGKMGVGLDPLVGLVPVVGDVAMALAALYVVAEGRRLGCSGRAVALMLGNVAFDMLVGFIPAVGDAVDFVFRANRRNLAIIEGELGLGPEEQSLGADD